MGRGLKEIGFWVSEVGEARRDRLAYDLELKPGEQWQLIVKFNRDHARGGPREPFTG